MRHILEAQQFDKKLITQVFFEAERMERVGHREVGLLAGKDWRQGAYKTCPGRSFDLDRFRQELETPA